MELHIIKAAVNRNTLFLVISILAICPQQTVVAKALKKSSHLLSIFEPTGYTIIEKVNAVSDAPVGSLLKPFAAWYLLEQGLNAANKVFCPPEKKRRHGLRCWTPNGHGPADLTAALVHSCNYYFLSLFAGRNLADYENWLRHNFDWPANLAITKPVHVYGFDLDHGIDPEKLVKMYHRLLLAAESGNSHAMTIRNALAEICRGTLADYCEKMKTMPQFKFLLGKTGTVQIGKQPFGIAVLLLEHSPSQKKILLLCYERGKTGSQAALAAPAILKKYAERLRKNKNLGH